eukprot:scaffold9857_cov127-Cylindrotheca_fusiformis.AAC.10
MPTITTLTESLDWPETLETTTIECAGEAFLEFQSLLSAGEDYTFSEAPESENDESDNDDALEEDEAPAVDLFSLSENALEELDYYKVLHLPFKANLTPDDVKKAYRKACLKYHPDKSGRGEEDAVFLKVKAAFDILSTQKLAYDSTEMPFDDSIPDENTDNFFSDFGSAFERNLHFDARLLPAVNNKKSNRRKSRSSRINFSNPPSLGDESTPIEQVHEFYDYWAHFESWRDFGMQASRELETQDQLEQAESRYEKRWYQKEIDRKAKKLKQQEQSRITTLVERAMASDPRLQQEKERLIKEKEEKQRRKEEEALEKIRQEEAARLAEERMQREAENKKKSEKLIREKEKKMLRKTKQAFRKIVGEALASLRQSEHALEDEVDLICTELNREQLTKLNRNLESKSTPAEVLELVRKRAANVEDKREEEESTPEIVQISVISSPESSVPKKVPFSPDEMSALAKGVKKFPAGGGNRWDQIAAYINNVCHPEPPRTKEECIEIFNQNKASRPNSNGATAPKTTQEDGVEDVWTAEQDKALQSALVEFPASMDKNERWANIAKSIPGKTKKQCVQRFKAIRDALKSKK